MSENLLALQNGSDIRGIALDGVENEKVNLTPSITQRIAAAFVAMLAEQTGKEPKALQISVGRDSRLSSPALKAGVLNGIAFAGAQPFDLSLCTTPAMFMSTVTDGYSYDGAVMVTASHLPYNKNGLKFFTKDGGFESAQIKKLLEAAEMIGLEGTKCPAAQKIDFLSAYAEHLKQIIRSGAAAPDNSGRPLTGMKIIVDAGNGGGGFYADKILKPLGADTEGSQFLEPDGRFPNHIPNPENPAAMESIRSAVLKSGADLGVIFDTDVDRAGAVAKSGDEINRNRLIALISAIVLEEHPGSIIVTDSVTSDELSAFIKSLGGVHHRFKRGYKNVINEAKRINALGDPARQSWLAIETSGHGALRENYFLDDGAYLISKIIVKAARLRREGKTLESLLSALGEPAEAQEFRFKIKAADFKAYGGGILKDLADYAQKEKAFCPAAENHEGVRVSLGPEAGDGWFLLRMSLHEPILPLNVESRREGGVAQIARRLLEFLKSYAELDLSPLTQYLARRAGD